MHQHILDAKDFKDTHSQNLFVEIASEIGFVGLFFFIGRLINWTVESYRSKRPVLEIIVPFGEVFVISSQFEATFDANNTSIIFFYHLNLAERKK